MSVSDSAWSNLISFRFSNKKIDLLPLSVINWLLPNLGAPPAAEAAATVTAHGQQVAAPMRTWSGCEFWAAAACPCRQDFRMPLALGNITLLSRFWARATFAPSGWRILCMSRFSVRGMQEVVSNVDKSLRAARPSNPRPPQPMSAPVGRGWMLRANFCVSCNLAVQLAVRN
jgi:hypothetical protein